jgi:SulP family sulfate permease
LACRADHGVIWFLPKLTKAFPAPLAGILVVSGLVLAFGLDTRSVGDLASIAGGLPHFTFRWCR